MRLLRLFNENRGTQALIANGVDPDLVKRLDLLGISGIGNLIAAIKFAKYNELSENDLVVSIATDSMQLYGSRLYELTAERGPYSEIDAQKDIQLLSDVGIDNMKELSYYGKKAIHHLKYYTWIEQQGKKIETLNDQWYDHTNYWGNTFGQAEKIDELISQFNARVGIVTEE
jgi:cysteine synthase